MEQGEDRRVVLHRVLPCLLGSAGAGGLTSASGARGLDVATWSVLTPLVVGALLELAPRAAAQLRLARAARRPPVVLPDRIAPATPDPAVQARDAAVEQLRGAVLAAREDGAPMEQLLVLVRALHEAELDRARAVLTAGGQVPQALRDELELRVRPEPVRPPGLQV